MPRDIIAIGGSLGAVDAVKQLCRHFPPDLAAAVLVVIHVGSEGNNLLASIFDQQSAIPVATAVDGEPVKTGRIYVAPADHHLLVSKGAILLGRGPRENMARPAVDPLFRSVGLSYGPRAIAAVLTGLLNDGAAGLADIKRCGALTVVQTPADAVAPDMPLGALATTNVDYRAPISEMGKLLVELTQMEAGPDREIPEDIMLEVEIAAGGSVDSELIAKLGSVQPLSCPSCGGVLSKIDTSEPLRFRCQVGHAFTADVLSGQQESTADEALRVALRMIEERRILTEAMARDAHRSGRHAAARSYEERAREFRRHAGTLRRAVLSEQAEKS